MTTVMSTTAKRDMAALLGAGALGRLSDAELLARFTSGRGDPASQAAFEAILTRHGPMVLGVCRRVLGDSHAAADAFQATFLILTRKAPTVRVEDSLGRWLHGVSVRVARRARAVARAEHARMRAIEGDGPAEDPESTPSSERDDLRRVIDEEIARLPARYRSPVILCYLEGLSQEQAARRLRCPLGTVHSRLHRARERLRLGLARRGLAPVGWGSAVLAATVAGADIPRAWVEASRDGVELAGTVSAAVSSLARWTLRGLLMSQIGRIGMILAGLALPVAGAFTIAARGDDTSAVVSRPDDVAKRGTSEETKRLETPPSERFRAIRDEYNARQSALWQAVEKAKDRREENEIYRTMSPDEVAYCRRMIDLALSALDDPAARDALVWIIDKPGMSDVGPYGTEFGRAAGMLVRHFGDDPEAIRVGLGLDNVLSPRREALLFGFVAAAKGRESKGLARLALAQFLERRAGLAAGAKKVQGRPKGIVDEDGKVVDKVIEQSDEEHAYYVLQLRLTDPDATRAEAERLYEEVIAEYEDIPHVTVKTRELEALLREPTPTWNGKLLTGEELHQLEGPPGPDEHARPGRRGPSGRDAQPGRREARPRDRRR